MKRTICFLIMAVFIIIPISGCSSSDKVEENEVIKVLDKTSLIKIADIKSNMYSIPLNISLTETEMHDLIEAIGNAPRKDTSFTGYLYYAFELYDEEEKLIDRIIIDTQKTVGFESGTILQRTEEVNSVVKSIEKNHNITMDIWDRKPDVGYFSLFDLVDHGQLYEITENNFIDGLKRDLSKTDCVEIANEMVELSFSDEMLSEIDKKYVLEFYTINGASLYTLYIDSNEKIYTEQGYEINSEALKAKIISLSKK